METSPPHILCLPAEVLSIILSLAVPYICPFHRHTPVGRVTLVESPFHCVRSTCRTFRQIVDQLPFWQDDQFDIADIEQFRCEPWWPTYDSTYTPGLVEQPVATVALLSDPHLQQCLVRKTGWVAASPRVFETLAREIPSFGQGVRYLDLPNGEFCQWVHVTNTLRDAFPILEDLHIYSEDHIHLNTLPQTLQKFTLTGPLVTTCDCHNDLPILKEFNYCTGDEDLEDDAGPFTFERLLPFSSRNTLQRFDFDFGIDWEPTDDAFQSFSLLQRLGNLTTLIMGYVSPHIFRFLARSSFRLQKFKASTGVLDSLQSFRDLLDSPVLHNVEDLSFDFGMDKDTTTEEGQEFEPLIQTIANLPVLESLKLLYPLKAEWFRHFENASGLKRVVWYYDRFADRAPVNESGDNEYVECLRRHWDWDVEVKISELGRSRREANLGEGGSAGQDIASEDFDEEFDDHEADNGDLADEIG
jgi:hypothetical protein